MPPSLPSKQPPTARPYGRAAITCPTAPTDSTVEWEVTLAAVGRHVTHGRAVGRVEGREILTVNASLGIDKLDVEGIWIEPPEVPAPDECPPRALPVMFRDSINEQVELRAAKGRHFEEIGGTPGPPGPPDSALWARLPEHIFPSAAVLAIVGDFIPGAMSQPIGQRAMARSLDNTLRVVQLAATEWVLCDIRIHALAGGYGHGTAFLWSEDGDLLAIASQSDTASASGPRTPSNSEPAVNSPLGFFGWVEYPHKQRWCHADGLGWDSEVRQPGVRGRFRRRQDPSVAVIRRERCTRVRRSQIVRVPGLEPWPLRGGTTTAWPRP